MLAQHEGDTGSVSGVMNSLHTVMGSLGIIIVSLELWERVELIGTLILGLSVVSLVLWFPFGRRLAQAQSSRPRGST